MKENGSRGARFISVLPFHLNYFHSLQNIPHAVRFRRGRKEVSLLAGTMDGRWPGYDSHELFTSREKKSKNLEKKRGGGVMEFRPPPSATHHSSISWDPIIPFHLYLSKCFHTVEFFLNRPPPFSFREYFPLSLGLGTVHRTSECIPIIL